MALISFRVGLLFLDLIVCLFRLFWLCDCVLKCLWRFFVFGRVCARELRLNLHFFGFFINTNRSNLCPSSWMLCLYLEMIMRGFCLGVIVLDLIVCLLRFLGFAWLKMNAHQTNHRTQKAWNRKAIRLYLTTYMLDMLWFVVLFDLPPRMVIMIFVFLSQSAWFLRQWVMERCEINGTN